MRTGTERVRIRHGTLARHGAAWREDWGPQPGAGGMTALLVLIAQDMPA